MDAAMPHRARRTINGILLVTKPAPIDSTPRPETPPINANSINEKCVSECPARKGVLAKLLIKGRQGKAKIFEHPKRCMALPAPT